MSRDADEVGVSESWRIAVICVAAAAVRLEVGALHRHRTQHWSFTRVLAAVRFAIRSPVIKPQASARPAPHLQPLAMSKQHQHGPRHGHKESSVSQSFTLGQQHQHSHKMPPMEVGSPGPRQQAEARLHGFHRCNSSKINFWSLGGEALNRMALRFHLAKFGIISKLFLQPDSLGGYVVYAPGADLSSAAGSRVAVAGGSCVAFVRASLPRVFLGGLSPGATDEVVQAAVAPYGRVAKFERPKKRKRRKAGFCMLTFFRKEEVMRILQQQRLEVLGRKVSVRMEGEMKEKDRIYDAYGPEWREGHTLLLYGFSEPDALTEQDVREAMSKYGSVRAVNFVFARGCRQPRCFVDFGHVASVAAALRQGACCVQGQLVGFMEATSSFLAAVTHRPKVRVTEDPMDDDLEVSPVREFDITKEEKKEALRRAVSVLDAVSLAFLPADEAPLVENIKRLASTCPEDETLGEDEGKPGYREMSEEEEEEGEGDDWEYNGKEEYEHEKDHEKSERNNKRKTCVSPSEGVCKKMRLKNPAKARTVEPSEAGMENKEDVSVGRMNPCVRNYCHVREKVLELTRRWLAQWEAANTNNNNNNWPRMLRMELQRRQGAVLRPAPAMDTLEAGGWKGDEYVHNEECRVYVQHLPEGVERQALKRYFSRFGDVLRLYLTGGNKGFVEYEFPASVAAVLSKTRHVVCGVEIRVLKNLRDRPQVWVGNLPLGAAPEEVVRALGVFGVVLDVDIPLGHSYGFVTFADEEVVQSAVACGEAFLGGTRLFVKQANRN